MPYKNLVPVRHICITRQAHSLLTANCTKILHNFQSVFPITIYLNLLTLLISHAWGILYKQFAEGEYVVGQTYESVCVELLRSGADNVEIVYMEEGTTSGPFGAGIIRNIKQAKTFAEYLTSASARPAMCRTSPRARQPSANLCD